MLDDLDNFMIVPYTFVFPSGKKNKKSTDIIEMLVTCTFHGKLIIQLQKRKILQKA